MLKSDIYLSLYLLIFVTNIMYSENNCSCDLPHSNFAIGVNLIYFKCNNETPTMIPYPIAEPQELLDVLEEKRTIFCVFGFDQTLKDTYIQTMMKALCYGRTDNVVFLDWDKYAHSDYLKVFQNGEKVGSLFANAIQKLVNSGLNISNIYIIGHSLGVHIASFAGKCNNFTIPRITALDPVSSAFYSSGCYLKLNDASWIDIIYTDMGGYSSTLKVGTSNYYANGGTCPQPGCIPIDSQEEKDEMDLCCHKTAMIWYAESKIYPSKYMAVNCSSYINYKMNKCENNTHTTVGYAAVNVSGSFYFSTGKINN